mmetsp:Transcript_5858/g.9446  ORF Transcript_5858/g.9446 Transcript_5858/m.9446 type:complete len:111 (+) Transcript_5858:771-1103(+)
MYPGLEVEVGGEYKPIKPVENAIVVNIGDTLEEISGFQIKATRHRVADIGCERFSAPFFLDPKFSARISKDVLKSSRKLCEDLDYDTNPTNEEEVKGLAPFGEKVCNKIS